MQKRQTLEFRKAGGPPFCAYAAVLIAGCAVIYGCGDGRGSAPAAAVAATSPASGAMEVAADAKIGADFTQPMAGASLNAATFEVACPGGTVVAGSVVYDAPNRRAVQHPPNFHNGTAATLEDVVVTCNARLALGLSATEVADLAEYLKSL